MHPIMRRFSERSPRIYGFVMLLIGTGFAAFWRKDNTSSIMFILVSVGFGIAGLLHVIFGRMMNSWNAQFEAILAGTSISLRQVVVIVGLGLVYLATSMLIYTYL
jgi:hypothetical protein